jgi:hypothetical protein
MMLDAGASPDLRVLKGMIALPNCIGMTALHAASLASDFPEFT